MEMLRNYVVELREERNRLITKIFQEVRRKLEVRYADPSFQELGALKESMLAVMKLDNIGLELTQWWQKENAFGLAENRHLRYFEYQAPLRMLRMIDAKLLSFRERIIRLKYFPDASRAHYLGLLAAIQETLNRNLVKLEQGGWQSQLTNQVKNDKRRLEMPELYKDECLVAVHRHLEVASTVIDLNQFKKAENLFRTAIDSCVK